MAALGYEYEGGGIETNLLMTMSHAEPSTLPQAIFDWQNCIFGLPAPYNMMVINQNVTPMIAADDSQSKLEDQTAGTNGVADTEVDTIAAKKQRALKLLQDQGLSGALNGI
jgi:hypothetical protein